MTNKETTNEKIHKEEADFLGVELGEMFVEPANQIAGYESIKVDLVECTPYDSWIRAAVPACFCTWDMSPLNPVSNGMMQAPFEEQEKRVLNILKSRPISVAMEFPTFLFNMTGVPRAMTHQIVRHRQMAFGQQSYRVSSCFSDPVRAPQTLIDWSKVDDVKGNGAKVLLEEYEKMVRGLRFLYKGMIEYGVPMEQARCLMPMGTCTKISMCTRFGDLIAYMKARTIDISQDEHTYIVCLIAKEVRDKQPKYWEFIKNAVKGIEDTMRQYKVIE